MSGLNRKYVWAIAGLFCIAAAAALIIRLAGDGKLRTEDAPPVPPANEAANGGRTETGEDYPSGTAEERTGESGENSDNSDNGGERAEIVDMSVSTVERESELRDYRPGEPVYFSDADVRVFFDFRKNESGRISAIKEWYPETAVYTESGGERIAVSFERTDNDHERLSQLTLKLQGAPPRDVHIELIGADGGETIRQTLKYAQPFHYDIYTEDRLQQLMAEARAADELFNLPWRFGEGKEVRLDLIFTAPADRESAETRFADMFGDHAWQADWRSDREVALTVTFDADLAPRPVEFNLSGIVSAEGYQLADRRAFQIYPEKPAVYGRTETATGERAELFRAPYPYVRLLPSGDGTLALAQLNERTEAGPSWYVLLDLQHGGDIVRAFAPNGIEQPQWVGNGRTFVYAGPFQEGPSMWSYDADTDAANEIWTSPRGAATDHSFHWLQPIEAPNPDNVWMLDYTSTSENYAFSFSADLYEFTDQGKRKLRSYADIMQGRCEGFICYGHVLPITSGKLLYWQQFIDANQPPYGEYRTFDMESGTSTLLMPGEDQQVIPLDEQRFLIVQQKTEGDRSSYDYSVYDAEQNRSELLFRRDVPLSHSLYRGAVPYEPNKYLVGDGWRSGIIDVARKTYTTVRFELLDRTERHIYWREWPDGN